MTAGPNPARDPAPQLSVVIATDALATIADLLDALAAQTVAGLLELVVVCPPGAIPEAAVREIGGVGSTRLVEHALVPLGPARAAGVRAALSPLVVVAETHAFPEREWAQSLLSAHESEWVAVMPAVANANRDSALSWSAYLVDYGRWGPWNGAAEISDPPTYHATFRREALVAFGPRLGVLLEPGSALPLELAHRELRSSYEPRARVWHLNVAQPRAWLHERFLGGRLLAAARRSRWPRHRTAVYMAGSPLVPLIRLWRTRVALARAWRYGLLPRWTVPATIAGCIAWGAGEAVGYAVGTADTSAASMVEYELHKDRYLGRGDRTSGPGNADR